MSNQKFDKITVRISRAWQDLYEKYDIGALPAFIVFFVVVTLGMVLNFNTMRHAIGDLSAALVSGIFEAGILGWKITSNRKKNNDGQDEVVTFATGISVGLATIMLVINLFRTTMENLSVDVTNQISFNGWQIAAYLVIGAAALTHVICYLVFDGRDVDKQYSKKNARSKNDIAQRQHESRDVIDNTRADLDIMDKIVSDLADLQKTYANLPGAQLEIVLENARQELLSKYEASPLVKAMTQGLADLNKDGKIADTPIPAPSPLPSKYKKLKVYTFEEYMAFLEEAGYLFNQIIQYVKENPPLAKPLTAWTALLEMELIPEGMSVANFVDIHKDLMARAGLTVDPRAPLPVPGNGSVDPTPRRT